MWVVGFFLSYLILALIIPTSWALVPVWRKARASRHVDCPASSHIAMVDLDPWYAVKMHTLGNQELRIKDCSRWPGQRNCDQACLVQIGVG
jgi:hypothetical protein